MSATLGRNDLCHCGSGKKYKRCHLPIEEKARPAPKPPLAARPPEDYSGPSRQATADWSVVPRTDESLFDVLTKFKRSGLAKRDPKPRRIFQDNETLLTYLASREKIDAACAQLEAYGKEFDQFLNDNEAYVLRNQELFGEDSFIPLRFTAAEIEKGFREVGFPPDLGATEEVHKTYIKALLYLASKERRNQFAMELLMRVPEYVAQGRFIDACLITFTVQETAQSKDDFNPFLLRMFLFGLMEWTKQRQEEQIALLRDAGLNPKANISPDEIEAWIAEQRADPVKAAQLQRLLDAHPELRQPSAATLDEIRRNAIGLLDRADAAPLLLQFEEVEPWAPFLMRKLQIVQTKFGESHAGAEVSATEREDAFSNILVPAMREMTKGIFTPERIRKLVAALKAYRRDLFAAGDQTAAYYATGAISYVEDEDDPAQNVFLLNLCFRSFPGIDSQPDSPSPATLTPE